MDSPHTLSLPAIRTGTRAYLDTHILTLPHDLVPWHYLETLDTSDRTIATRLCLIGWLASKRTQVPRELQLRTALALHARHSTLVIAGTGSGKTLATVLLVLLDGMDGFTISISPLTRLQVTQVKDFNDRYGVPTVAINEDTDGDEEWWRTNIYDLRRGKQTLGPYRHLVVTTEQLFKDKDGRLQRMGEYIRHALFRPLLRYIIVDEVHTAFFDGIPHYGQPAFRPSWGRLHEIQLTIGDTVPWLFQTATCPAHVHDWIRHHLLLPDHVLLKTTVNRPNTVYATHCVVGTLENTDNYHCFIRQPYDAATQPRVLLFCDSSTQITQISLALERLLPVSLRDTGIVLYYHSSMSKAYLEYAHNEFVDGKCRILLATKAESTGIDFPHVDIVGQLGLPSSVCDGTQRGGRVIRVGDSIGLFVTFHEAWVYDVDISEFENEFVDDPDRPRTSLDEKSSRRDRAPMSWVRLICGKECIRLFFAKYFDDQDAKALDHLHKYCCDRHDDGFDLESFLPGKLFRGTPSTTGTAAGTAPTPRNKYRIPAEQKKLLTDLIVWRRMEHLQDPLRAVCPENDILTLKEIVQLSRVRLQDLLGPASLSNLLNRHASDWVDVWRLKLWRRLLRFETLFATRKSPKRPRSDSTALVGPAAKRARVGTSIASAAPPRRIILGPSQTVNRTS